MGNPDTRLLNSELVGRTNGSGPGDSRTLCFGIFELDLRAGELRRNGSKVRLQEQPFQLLSQLLERPGDVVTREEIRDRLWPADTFVDFDHSLNAAIRRVRDALGDSAENPTFVETVARRGYRFLAPVTSRYTNGGGSVLFPLPTPVPATPRVSLPAPQFWFGAGVAAILLLLVGVGLGLLLGRTRSPSLPAHIWQLTNNPADDRIRSAAISWDGKYLAFADETGFYLRQIDTGETHDLALPQGMKAGSMAWFPDGTHLVIAMTPPGERPSLWVISTLGGAARKLNDEGRSPAVSPDGNEIAFITGPNSHQELRLVNADGSQPHRVAGEEGDLFGNVAWSPDGSKLACTRGKNGYGYAVNGEIEILQVHGKNVTAPVLLNHWTSTGLGGALAWTADQHLVYAMAEPPPHVADSNLWSVELDRRSQRVGAPSRVTSDSGLVFAVSATADAKRLVYIKGIPQPDVYIAALHGKGVLSEPQRLTLNDRQDMPFDWTIDGKEVIFTSDRAGELNIYKQAIDKPVPELLVRSPHPLVQARLSPDGSQLLYLEYPKWGETAPSSPLMRIPLAGGTPQKILEADWISNHQCARAPATVCVYSVVGKHDLTFFTFDPFKGKGSQFLRLTDELPQFFNWSLSPDGTTLAIAKGKIGDQEPKIHLVSLNGDRDRWLTIQGWSGISSLDWAADSRSLWAPSVGEEENALLNIDLEGHARAVWRPKKKYSGWAIPSRDGRHLAIYVGSTSANAWMLERP